METITLSFENLQLVQNNEEEIEVLKEGKYIDQIYREDDKVTFTMGISLGYFNEHKRELCFENMGYNLKLFNWLISLYDKAIPEFHEEAGDEGWDITIPYENLKPYINIKHK